MNEIQTDRRGFLRATAMAAATSLAAGVWADEKASPPVTPTPPGGFDLPLIPDVKWDKELVDASTARMINRPASLDTIVATNLQVPVAQNFTGTNAWKIPLAPAIA